jgi:hypothetical protein
VILENEGLTQWLRLKLQPVRIMYFYFVTHYLGLVKDMLRMTRLQAAENWDRCLRYF